MSVLLRHQKTGQLHLWVKGADREIFPRLTNSETSKDLQDACDELASQGLRVLVWAARPVSVEEFQIWKEEHDKFLDQVENVNDPKMDRSWNALEHSLEPLGATAIEDKLQPGVSRTIQYLQAAGLHVSIATGDSENTAYAIVRQLGLCPMGASFVTVGGNLADKDKLVREKAKEALATSSKDKVLVVDGKALEVLTEDSKLLDELVTHFSLRVFARVSAIQKSEVARIFQRLQKRVLAIGDGGNDVTMIQEANIGVGIRGVEGHEAAKAADFQLTHFEELQPLIAYNLQSHFQLASVYLWNDFKAVLLALIAYFSRASQGFSGDGLIPGELIFTLNTFDLSYPVIIFGIFEQFVPLDRLMKEAQHYQLGLNLTRFNGKKKVLWWIHATLNAMIIVALSSRSSASALQIGVTAAQTAAMVCNFRLLLESRRWHSGQILTCATSAVGMLIFAKLNPMGQRMPNVLWDLAFQSFGLCAAVDVLLLLVFEELPQLSMTYWRSLWDEYLVFSQWIRSFLPSVPKDKKKL